MADNEEIDAEDDAEDEFAEDEEIEDLDEELADDDIVDDDLPEDLEETFEADDLEVFEEDEEEDTAAVVPAKTRAKPAAEDDDAEEGDEDDEDLNPDDVEADLDTILKDRLVVVDDEDDDEDEVPEVDERGESTKVRPKSPGEFVCQSCFLVKHPSQLADAKRQYCRDCV